MFCLPKEKENTKHIINKTLQKPQEKPLECDDFNPNGHSSLSAGPHGPVLCKIALPKALFYVYLWLIFFSYLL